jgi:hypothetical protein
MPHQRNTSVFQHEGRLQLALLAYNSGQFRSHRAAAEAFNIKHHKLSDRAKGIPFHLETLPKSRKLTLTKEQTIVQYILDLD